MKGMRIISHIVVRAMEEQQMLTLRARSSQSALTEMLMLMETLFAVRNIPCLSTLPSCPFTSWSFLSPLYLSLLMSN